MWVVTHWEKRMCSYNPYCIQKMNCGNPILGCCNTKVGYHNPLFWIVSCDNSLYVTKRNIHYLAYSKAIFTAAWVRKQIKIGSGIYEKTIISKLVIARWFPPRAGRRDGLIGGTIFKVTVITSSLCWSYPIIVFLKVTCEYKDCVK